MSSKENPEEEKNQQLITVDTKIESNTEESNNEDPEMNEGNENAPDEEDPARTWFMRTFSKIGPGSVRSSIFSLSIISIGLGCLALPAKFQDTGIIGCLVLLAISGVATYYSLSYLTEAGHKYKIDNYSEVVKFHYGEKASKTLDILIIIYIYGAIILYQIFSKPLKLNNKN